MCSTLVEEIKIQFKYCCYNTFSVSSSKLVLRLLSVPDIFNTMARAHYLLFFYNYYYLFSHILHNGQKLRKRDNAHNGLILLFENLPRSFHLCNQLDHYMAINSFIFNSQIHTTLKCKTSITIHVHLYTVQNTFNIHAYSTHPYILRVSSYSVIIYINKKQLVKNLPCVIF